MPLNWAVHSTTEALDSDMNSMRVGWYASLAFSLSASTVVAPISTRAQAPRPPAPAAIRRLAGCYWLAWHSPASSKDSSAFAALPARFELLRTSLAASFEGYAVRPVSLWPGQRMPASWAPAAASGDSLIIGWSTGFHGIELFVGVRGDSLVGRARPFSDTHVRGAAPPPEADVVAVRVSCVTRKSQSR